MKSLYALLLTVMVAGTVFAGGEVRVDLFGGKKLKLREITATPPLRWRRFPVHMGTDREEASALIVSSPLDGEKWSEFEISFVPEKDGLVSVDFHTPGSRDPAAVKPVLIREVNAVGAALKNGSFAKLQDGKPQFWKLGKQAEAVRDENSKCICLKVVYNSGRASQLFAVKGGQKVVLTFKAKLAE